MPARRVVKPYEPPEPSKGTAQFTGAPGFDPLEVTIYTCPICGRNGEDLKLIEGHIKEHPAPEVTDD